ncbi:MAG: hydantoinase B/oxoprolinase family protein [Acidimicrobiales bacterium]
MAIELREIELPDIELSDLDLLDRMHPEKPSVAERENAEAMSDTEFAIFRHKLATIATEGKEVMAKLGVSTPLRSEDSGTGIFTAAGDMAGSAAGVYYHALSGQLPIKYTLGKWVNDSVLSVDDGDIFFSTDPTYGATHTPDQIAFMPVQADGILVGWVTAVAHQSDVGGQEPGLSARAGNAWCDGMRILPQKIGENLELREDLVQSIGNMTRVPDEQVLDLKARVAACTRMRERLMRLIDETGRDRFIGALRRCVDDGRIQVRRRLQEFNDGTYRATVFIDGVGGDMGLQRIHCCVTKQGEELRVDLSGTSPQNPFAFNAYANMPVATLANPFFSYLLSDVPPSIGLLDQIEVHVPDGTILSASPDAAVSCSLWPTFLLQAAAHCCLTKMAFDSNHRDKLSATQSANAVGGYGIGVNQHGLLAADLYVDPVNGSGGGARPDADGVDVFTGIWGNYMDTNDAEEVEIRGPYFKLYSRITTDGGGFGRFRGGSGQDTAYIAHKVPDVLMHGTMGFGSKFPTGPGLYGGYAGNTTPGVFIKGSNIKELMAAGEWKPPGSTADLVEDDAVTGDYVFDYATYPIQLLGDGDVFMMVGAGGGGWGDALDRDPELVMADLRSGVTSDHAVADIYKVAYDEDSLLVDTEQTEQLRADAKAERLSEGMPYAEFMQEWEQTSPPEAALTYFGEWPGQPA